ncbi:hypothetical protein C3941_22220 [Kaistia algarum]|nr:hypothetical protein C3941_22220 [Kaistia algarum]
MVAWENTPQDSLTAGSPGRIRLGADRLRIHVINLERRPDRRNQFMEWNGHQPLRFEFLAAADGRRIDRARLIEQGLLDPADREFNNGALGNALSQLSLWQACAAGHQPFLVFEDDACLRGDFWRHARPLMERYLSAHPIILFGFNTDAVTALRGADGFVSVVRFDERIKRRPGYFRDYGKLQDVRPQLFQCLQFWGSLAYAITPAGARALINACFPLSSRARIEMIGEGRSVIPCGVDGMMNVALQEGRLKVLACYPPLVLGPNSHADSDIQRLGTVGAGAPDRRSHDQNVSATPARKSAAG